MPMTQPGEFGTNADGNQNQEYCRYCFQDGQFTWPDATREDFTEKLVGMADKMGMTAEQASAMAQSVLPTLKRWKTE